MFILYKFSENYLQNFLFTKLCPPSTGSCHSSNKFLVTALVRIVNISDEMCDELEILTLLRYQEKLLSFYCRYSYIFLYTVRIAHAYASKILVECNCTIVYECINAREYSVHSLRVSYGRTSTYRSRTVVTVHSFYCPAGGL